MIRRFWLKNYRFVIDDGTLTVYDMSNKITDSFTDIDKLNIDELALLVFSILRDKGYWDLDLEEIKKVILEAKEESTSIIKEFEVPERFEIPEKVYAVVKKEEELVNKEYSILLFIPEPEDFLVKIMDNVLSEDRDIIETTEIMKKEKIREGAFLCKNGVVHGIRVIPGTDAELEFVKKFTETSNEVIIVIDVNSMEEKIMELIEKEVFKFKKVTIISIGWHFMIDKFRKKLFRSGHEYGYYIVTSIDEVISTIAKKISRKICGKSAEYIIL
ncbi:MAG: hypothetical protein ACP6IS_07160 [Candidatus Asgardarchaeia archaeon]